VQATPRSAPVGAGWKSAWNDCDDGELTRVERSLALCIGLPILLASVLGTLGEFLLAVLQGVIWVGLPTYVLLRGLHTWTLSDHSLARTFLEDLRIGLPGAPVGAGTALQGLPITTLGLVLANVAIHYLSPDPFVYTLRLRDPAAWWATNLSCMFAHAGDGHLWANMFFLWVFGSAVEGRVSSGRLFLLYLALGTVANGFFLLATLSVDHNPPGILGASGAISGLMGLFLVRCHFARLDLGVPILGIVGAALPLVLRVRVPATVLLTLFLLGDLVGARAQLLGSDAGIAYWAHVGGFVCGILVAVRTGLFHGGVWEALELRAVSREPQAEIGAGSAARNRILELDPDHVAVRLERARRLSTHELRPEANDDYLHAVRILLRRDRAEAARVFAESFRRYRTPLSASEQLRLTPALEGIGELEIAARALEQVVASAQAQPDEREKALLYEARLLLGLDLDHAAFHVYEDFLRTFPDSPARPVVEEKLAKLESEGAWRESPHP
jgi:membrane associated rhomboid family serine protease